MAIALAFHLLAATVWIGGMFFAYVCLRPVLGQRQPVERLQIWRQTFGKFFAWVWLAVGILFFSGFYMLFQLGGFGNVGGYVYMMLGLAVVMTAIFKFIYLAPFKHLKAGVESGDVKVAAFALATIRKLVAINLTLGFIIIIVATAGKSILA